MLGGDLQRLNDVASNRSLYADKVFSSNGSYAYSPNYGITSVMNIEGSFFESFAVEAYNRLSQSELLRKYILLLPPSSYHVTLRGLEDLIGKVTLEDLSKGAEALERHYSITSKVSCQLDYKNALVFEPALVVGAKFSLDDMDLLNRCQEGLSTALKMMPHIQTYHLSLGYYIPPHPSTVLSLELREELTKEALGLLQSLPSNIFLLPPMICSYTSMCAFVPISLSVPQYALLYENYLLSRHHVGKGAKTWVKSIGLFFTSNVLTLVLEGFPNSVISIKEWLHKYVAPNMPLRPEANGSKWAKLTLGVAETDTMSPAKCMELASLLDQLSERHVAGLPPFEFSQLSLVQYSSRSLERRDRTVLIPLPDIPGIDEASRASAAARLEETRTAISAGPEALHRLMVGGGRGGPPATTQHYCAVVPSNLTLVADVLPSSVNREVLEGLRPVYTALEEWIAPTGRWRWFAFEALHCTVRGLEPL